jgi:hypothetical protein
LATRGIHVNGNNRESIGLSSTGLDHCGAGLQADKVVTTIDSGIVTIPVLAPHP